MKIGILTYHRTYNYGGCLQALATRLILENEGHQVYYVDYWPNYHKRSYSLVPLKSLWAAPTLLSGIRAFVESILHLPYTLKRRNNFRHFLNENIIAYCKPLTEEYDVIIYGSDQIWRKQPFTNDFNPIYFAKNSFRAKKHVAFSASMGVLPTEIVDIENVRTLCQNFNNMSVRESDLCLFLREHGFPDTCVTLDPTLLVPMGIWDACMKITDYKGPKYVLFYELNMETFNIEKVRRFAKNKGLLLKVITGRAKKNDSETEITTAGPYEFVKWIKNAEYVFSSSFHGLAFSLIYGKEVFVSFKNNAQRAKSLLNIAGIPERFIAPGADIPEFPSIDYLKVISNLSPYREASLNYLSAILYEK